MAGKPRKTPGWTPPLAPTREDWWAALAQLGRLQTPEAERVSAAILRQLVTMPLPQRQVDLIRFNKVVLHLVAGETREDACDKASKELAGKLGHGSSKRINDSFQAVQRDESLWAVRWPCAYGLSICRDGQCQHDKRRKCGSWAEYWAAVRSTPR